MIEKYSLKNNKDAVIVAVQTIEHKDVEIEDFLDELEFLALTAGIKSKKRFIQKLRAPDPKYYVGKGKLEEIKEFAQSLKIEIVIFDDDLSPSQIKNIEKVFDCKIYDRSLLILDIFSLRAKTAQARAQVELAMNQYLLPRLTRMWTHLERQRGGTGTRGGAGEKEIETDRRIIRNQIKQLEIRLKKIDKQMKTQRKNRGGLVRVSLVGYTNVGKSTIMNLLAKSKVKAENKLFATVESTVRKVYYAGIPFLLSDTVGFIRKLPHHLVESFKSTLDEITESDVLVHVIDASHPFHKAHIKVVEETLAELGIKDKPVLYVYNKIDMLPKGEKRSVNGKGNEIYISASNKENMVEFRAKLMQFIQKEHYRIYPNYVNPESY